MTADELDGEVFLQRADEGSQGVLLLLGSGVGGMTVCVQTAFVGNADAVLIVAQGVCAHHVQRTGTPDVAVLADKEVIANHFHASCTVTAKEVFLGEVGVGPGGGAVDDEGRYPTHAVTPRAPAIAEATPMMILKMISHVLFFLFSMFFFFFTTDFLSPQSTLSCTEVLFFYLLSSRALAKDLGNTPHGQFFISSGKALIKLRSLNSSLMKKLCGTLCYSVVR